MPASTQHSAKQQPLRALLTKKLPKQLRKICFRNASLDHGTSSHSSSSQECCSSTRRISPFPILFEFDDDCAMECMVCLDGIKEETSKEDLDVLPCCHCFHRYCLNDWRLEQDTCPTCRYELDFFEMHC